MNKTTRARCTTVLLLCAIVAISSQYQANNGSAPAKYQYQYRSVCAWLLLLIVVCAWAGLTDNNMP